MKTIREQTECKPLIITNYINEKYPDCWNMLEQMRDCGVEYDKKRCYVPIGACLAVTGQEKDMMQSVYDSQIMAAAASWRIHKQVYRFTPEMQDMLMKQNGGSDMVVPVQALDNMPYQCIYIKLNGDTGTDGFFVHFESDVNTGELELRLLLIGDNNRCQPLILHLNENETLKDSVEKMLDQSQKNGMDFAETVKIWGIGREGYIQEYVSMVKPYLQLVLYLCAENKEVSENPEQKRITRIPRKKEYIRDKFREVQMWDCGVNITETIRKFGRSHAAGTVSVNNETQREISGTPKRPHSRRGHWHHYWTGHIGTQDRKLVLKWVAPTFIHAGTAAVQINVVQDLKGQEKND